MSCVIPWKSVLLVSVVPCLAALLLSQSNRTRAVEPKYMLDIHIYCGFNC
jgi:hypothetical protein